MHGRNRVRLVRVGLHHASCIMRCVPSPSRAPCPLAPCLLPPASVDVTNLINHRLCALGVRDHASNIPVCGNGSDLLLAFEA
jgi:hypothetical protein